MNTTAAPLDLGSDLALRYRWFTRASLGHPAKLHLGLLQYLLDHYTAPGDTICDPMAGVGSILYAATQQRNVIAREIEPAWLAHCHQNAARIIREAGLLAGQIDIGQHDAREPWGIAADHIVFSPPYGCAMSATPTAKGMLPHQVRRRLAKVPHTKIWERALSGEAVGAAALFQAHYGTHPDQLGHLRGARYWTAMEHVYRAARAALRPGGVLIVVIKDHIRDGRRVLVADQTVACCEQLGFALVARHQRQVWPLSLWQRRRKEKGLLVVEEEDALVFSGANHVATDH